MREHDLISVQSADFDLNQELLVLRQHQPGVGAIVSFVGMVRDVADGANVNGMELEHYPGMTEKALHDIVEHAYQRWDLQGVRLIHRVGQLDLQQQIVLVAVASKHRGAAFAACEFIMDYLKTAAPFWKKEYTESGAHWVDARDSDDQAMARWGIASANAMVGEQT